MQRLADDVADASTRVQRRVRVLEDHLHRAAERRISPAGAACVSRCPSKDVPRGGVEERRMARPVVDLPQPRLADQAEGLAARDAKDDAVDRLHGADLALDEDAAA